MDRFASVLQRASNFVSYYLEPQEKEDEMVAADLYPMIIQEAVQDPDPWKSLKATGRLAQVNKLFLKIVREIVRPKIVMRLLPELREVRAKWLEPKPKVFRMQISECLVMLSDWRRSARRVYTRRATRIGIYSSQKRAGIHDDLWKLLSGSVGLFAGCLAFDPDCYPDLPQDFSVVLRCRVAARRQGYSLAKS